MEKVIIYGLGHFFWDNQDLIEKKYEVIGYFDSNRLSEELPKKIQEKRISSLNEFKSVDYDKILITAPLYAAEIMSVLQKIGIKKEKIVCFSDTDESKKYWGKDPYRGISYSGGLEDLLIDSLIQKIGIDYSNMLYIELGVMDPIVASNTYFFYKRGASGILVEANPYLIERIKYVRSRDSVLNRAICENFEDGECKFYISENPGLSSIVENHTENVSGWDEFDIREEINIKTISINEVFQMANKQVDLLSIDIEGYDYTALSNLDFKKYSPKIIIAELNWRHLKDREEYQKIVDLLYENEYIIYAQNDFNGILVKKEYL